MKIFIKFLFLASYCLGQNVNISVDKNKISIDETIIFSVEVENSESFASFDQKLLKKDFMIVSGPNQQTNIQWVNGRMTSSKKMVWTLSPKKLGKLTIPSLDISVDGKNFKGKPIVIYVNKNSEDTDDNIFLIAEIDKEEAFLGEQITLTYKLFKRVNASIEQYKIPDFTGFWVENLFIPDRLKYTNVNIKGVNYQMANLGQIALFPIPSDRHLIPSLKIKSQIELKKKSKRRDPFFDPFFDSFFSETKTKLLTSKQKSIKIKKFPDPRPTDFNGAVGNFTVKSYIDRDSTIVNEGFTFTVKIEGTGNLNLFTIPKINFGKNLEVFDPIEKFEKDIFRDLLTGTKVWEYIIIPRLSGNLDLPSIQFSFFDPDKENWRQIKTRPKSVFVENSETIQNFGTGFTKEEIKLIGEDIRFFKNYDKNFLEDETITKYGFPIFMYVISLFLLGSPLIIKTLTGYSLFLNKDRKKRFALRIAQKTLKNSKNDEPFELSTNVIHSYLNNKLSVHSKNLDQAKLESSLSAHLVDSKIKKVVEIIKTCDAGRYSFESSEKRKTILKDVNELLVNIDKDLK